MTCQPWLVVALLSVLPAAATADRSDEGQQYNGGFLAAGVFAGPQFLESGRRSDVGWVTGAYARYSTVMQVLDVQAEYHVGGVDFIDGGTPLEMLRHSFSGSINLHPLFLRILNNNWLWYTLSAIYVQAGLSVELTDIEGAVADPDPAFSLHIGAGFDMPLHDPAGHGAFWLGFNWRWKFIYQDWLVAGRKLDPDAHLVLVVLSYRYNNISFTRVPRPDELEYR